MYIQQQVVQNECRVCGHDRQQHAEEQNYDCLVYDCNCEGFEPSLKEVHNVQR